MSKAFLGGGPNGLSFKGPPQVFQNSFSARFPLKTSNSFNLKMQDGVARTDPLLLGHDEIRSALEMFSIQGINQFEFEEMFEEATQYMKACTIEQNYIQVLELATAADGKAGAVESDPPFLPLPFLLAGSENFRQKLLRLRTDPIFCTLMTSTLSSFISEEQIRILAKGGKEREISRVGIKVFSSRKDADAKGWFYIVSGKLKVSLDSGSSFSDETAVESYEIGPGEYFGGFGILPRETGWSHIIFETIEPSRLLELSGENLALFFQRFEFNGKRLLSTMGGTLVSYTCSLNYCLSFRS